MENFDQIINRCHTNCYKWDSLIDVYGENNGIIPMGIADMDFHIAAPIEQALVSTAKQQILGYVNNPMKDVGALITKRYQDRGYRVNEEDIFLATGVVHAITNIVRAFTQENDKIVLPTPYYTPFGDVIKQNNREILPCPMVIRNNRYEIDLASIEDKIDEKTKMFIFCNPHNPTGRIYDRDEMQAVSDFCKKHRLLIIDDEIHADFALTKKYQPITSVSDYALRHSFTLLSITKTFNLAGLKVSFGFINNSELRDYYNNYASHTGLSSINLFGLAALKAAYSECQQWEKDLINYIRENCKYALDFIQQEMPEVKVYENEGTYLLWLDFSNFKAAQNDISEYLLKNAKVQLNAGNHYGEQYGKFARMNCALPRELLQQALVKVKNSLYE